MTGMDLHCHSRWSDGTFSPAAIVRLAKEKGLGLLALTDHDTMRGTEEALRAGEQLGVQVLPGVELDTRFPCELHILGLSVDPENPALSRALEEIGRRRAARNARILEQLCAAGVDLRPRLPLDLQHMTRLHIAKALEEEGRAESIDGAFRAFLYRGRVGHVEQRCQTPEAAIGLIHTAGGKAVLAHPIKLKADLGETVQRLAGAGLDGVEAFYPGTSAAQAGQLFALARTYRLFLTCGSDFHGDNRAVELGSAFTPSPELEKTRALLTGLLPARHGQLF